MTEAVVVKKTRELQVGITSKVIHVAHGVQREKVVVVCSGGLDSTTLLYYVTQELGFDAHVLTFKYGQKHLIEVDYIMALCCDLGLLHEVLVIPPLYGSSLTDDEVDIPKEDYSVESQKSTVVPNRNMVFLSIAAAYAISIGAKRVYYAAHHNDEAVYPDCRLEFVQALNVALKEGNYEPVEVYAPFIKMTKAKIVEIGDKLHVPFGDTWSCYDPVSQERGDIHKGFPSDILHTHCGVCGTCRERKNAFLIANVEDPTVYAKW